MEDPVVNNPGSDAFKSLAHPMGPNFPETGNSEPSLHLDHDDVKGTKLENAKHGDEHVMEIKVRHHAIEGPKGKARHHLKVVGFRHVRKAREEKAPEKKESKVKQVGGRLVMERN